MFKEEYLFLFEDLAISASQKEARQGGDICFTYVFDTDNPLIYFLIDEVVGMPGELPSYLIVNNFNLAKRLKFLISYYEERIDELGGSVDFDDMNLRIRKKFDESVFANQNKLKANVYKYINDTNVLFAKGEFTPSECINIDDLDISADGTSIDLYFTFPSITREIKGK